LRSYSKHINSQLILFKELYMSVFKVSINRFFSLAVLSALMCVPEMAEAVNNKKNSAVEKKGTRKKTQSEVVLVSSEVRKKNKNEEPPQDPEQEQEIPGLAVLLYEANNLKRVEREEDDENDPTKVKKERGDDETLACLVMDNHMAYIGENESNPRDVIDLAANRDEQPKQAADQAKPLLTGDEFHALRAKALNGDSNAMHDLATSFYYNRIKGVTKEKSYRLAFGLYREAAARGNTNAESQLGHMYAHERVAGESKEESYKIAFEWYTKAAAKGDARAESGLGWLYLDGHVGGVSKEESDKIAFEWYKKAAAKGYSNAEHELGYMYTEGLVAGVSKEESDKLAFEWCSKVAAKGYTIAEHQLGWLYSHERVAGVSKEESDKIAFEWYTKAAAKGCTLAEHQLGYMYTHGRVTGVSKEESDKLAFVWFRKAAAKGDTLAEYHLGYMYSQGRVAGVSRKESDKLALVWYRKAAAKGHKTSLEFIRNFPEAENIGDQQVIEVQKQKKQPVAKTVANVSVTQKQKKQPVAKPVANVSVTQMQPFIVPQAPCVMSFKRYFSAPEVQVELQKDVAKVIQFIPKAKLNDKAMTASNLGRIDKRIDELQHVAEEGMTFSSKSTICTLFEPCLLPFQKMLLDHTIPEYRSCYEILYTQPIFVSCINVNEKFQDQLTQDNSVFLWNNTVTLGCEMKMANRVLSQLESEVQPDMNLVYKDAQLLHQIACDKPSEFKITLPQDSSLRSCCTFVNSTLKTLEAAQVTYHVTLGRLVTPDPFEPVIKVFGSLQSAMSKLSQEMETAMKKEAPRRNAVFMKNEKLKFLRGQIKAHVDEEDEDY
jgi:TPR repeat protein